MTFIDEVSKWWGSGEDGQERILEISLRLKGDFIKHGDRTHGQEELHWDCEE